MTYDVFFIVQAFLPSPIADAQQVARGNPIHTYMIASPQECLEGVNRASFMGLEAGVGVPVAVVAHVAAGEAAPPADILHLRDGAWSIGLTLFIH